MPVVNAVRPVRPPTATPEADSTKDVYKRQPKSDVLYFELVDDAWVCIRPSGTEPKIKLYVNTNAGNPEDSAKENAELVEACKALMA